MLSLEDFLHKLLGTYCFEKGGKKIFKTMAVKMTGIGSLRCQSGLKVGFQILLFSNRTIAIVHWKIYSTSEE